MSQWEFQVLFGVTVPGETGVSESRRHEIALDARRASNSATA